MSVVPSCHNCCNPSPPRLYCEPSTRQHAIPTWKPVRHPPAIPESCIRNTTWMSVVPSCHNCCNPSPPRLYCEPSTRQHAIPTWKPVKHPPAIPGSCIRNTTWMSVVPSCHNCCNPSPLICIVNLAQDNMLYLPGNQ